MHQGAKMLIVFNDRVQQGGIEIETKLRGHFGQYKKMYNLYVFLFPFFQQQNCLVSKGQLISEQIYDVLNFPKMQQNIARISALASKMGQIKKVKAHYHPN